jgi:hypothetical protein
MLYYQNVMHVMSSKQMLIYNMINFNVVHALANT